MPGVQDPEGGVVNRAERRRLNREAVQRGSATHRCSRSSVRRTMLGASRIL